MLGFEIADGRRRDRITRLELFDDHILLRVMAGIRIVLEVVDDRADDLVIRTIAAIEYAQLRFKHAQQAFDVAMFLTQNPDGLSQHALSATSWPPTRPASGCGRMSNTVDVSERNFDPNQNWSSYATIASVRRAHWFCLAISHRMRGQPTDVAQLLVARARLYDLSAFPLKATDHGQRSIVEQLIFESGRPVLLWPEDATRELSSTRSHIRDVFGLCLQPTAVELPLDRLRAHDTQAGIGRCPVLHRPAR